MDKYTIYCTKEQTKKALELGAPIDITAVMPPTMLIGEKIYSVPTTEQMIGWLRKQGIYIIVPIPLIKDLNKNDFSKAYAFEYRIVINGNEPYSGEYLTPEEATLAAIDAALKYLENQ